MIRDHFRVSMSMRDMMLSVRRLIFWILFTLVRAAHILTHVIIMSILKMQMEEFVIGRIFSKNSITAHLLSRVCSSQAMVH